MCLETAFSVAKLKLVVLVEPEMRLLSVNLDVDLVVAKAKEPVRPYIRNLFLREKNYILMLQKF